MVGRKFILSFIIKTNLDKRTKKKGLYDKEDQGVIYTGNPKILKRVCPGVYGTIKPVGYCMIGKK